jgi:hypothetical protein
MAYVPWQQVTTADGRAGVLTGGEDTAGNPVVLFGLAAAAVPRDQVRSPVIHAYGGDTAAACRLALAGEASRDGDVIWVPAERAAAVICHSRPVQVTLAPGAARTAFGQWPGGGPGALAAADGGRYAAPVARASALLKQAAARAARTPDAPGIPFRPGDLVIRVRQGDAWMATGHVRAGPAAPPRLQLAAVTGAGDDVTVTGADAPWQELALIMPRPDAAPEPEALARAVAAAGITASRAARRAAALERLDSPWSAESP